MKKMLLFAACVFVVTFNASGYDRLTGRSFTSRSEVIARNGVAATSQPLATQAAIDILKQGGNAVDAAIAANAMRCLVAPVRCGIGRALFALGWDANTQQRTGRSSRGSTQTTPVVITTLNLACPGRSVKNTATGISPSASQE